MSAREVILFVFLHWMRRCRAFVIQAMAAPRCLCCYRLFRLPFTLFHASFASAAIIRRFSVYLRLELQLAAIKRVVCCHDEYFAHHDVITDVSTSLSQHVRQRGGYRTATPLLWSLHNAFALLRCLAAPRCHVPAFPLTTQQQDAGRRCCSTCRSRHSGSHVHACSHTVLLYSVNAVPARLLSMHPFTSAESASLAGRAKSVRTRRIP